MRSFLISLGLIALVSLASPSDSHAQNFTLRNSILSSLKSSSLTNDQFAEMWKFIQPSKSENKWRETPWIPSIHDGRKLAAAKQKPLFLWAMNGDPLGCV